MSERLLDGQPRGLKDYATFADTHGMEITVRQSSAADEPCVWLFLKQPAGMDGMVPHLNSDQVVVLINALVNFLAVTR